jgi:hypothetical protein
MVVDNLHLKDRRQTEEGGRTRDTEYCTLPHLELTVTPIWSRSLPHLGGCIEPYSYISPIMYNIDIEIYT